MEYDRQTKFNPTQVGERLRAWGKKRFKNLTILSEKMNVSYVSLQRYLNNERNLTAVHLLTLSQLGCDIHWLLTGANTPVEAIAEKYLLGFLRRNNIVIKSYSKLQEEINFTKESSLPNLKELARNLFLSGRFNVEELAKLLGVSSNYLYRIGIYEKGHNGFKVRIPLEIILPAMQAQHDFSLLKYMANECGFVLIKAEGLSNNENMNLVDFLSDAGLKAEIKVSFNDK